jgi:peptide/nickel transport system substrate-binding protein
MRLPVLIIACSLIMLTACSQPGDDTIRFGLASAPANLDPRYATDATSARINRLLYRRLVDFDENTRPRAALADWEVLSPTHYRFHLDPRRAGFHDGRALTAADVAATYQSILDPDKPSPHAGTLKLIDRITVLDDDTLDFTLKRPDPLFPGYLVIGLLPAEAIAGNHPFHESPLGSGPFMLRDWPEPGRLSLTRREDGQVIEFQAIGDPTVRVLKLLRGEVDILQNDLPAELLAYLDSKQDVQVTYAEGSNFAYIGFNLEDPQTSDLRVRQAIAHAINREAIIEYVLGGAARPAAALLPPDHWAGNPALQGYTFDPARARSLLAEAGFDPAHPLKLTYKTSTDAVRIRIATIIQQQLRDVGIETGLQSYDWGTFYGDIKSGHFQMYSLAWVGIKTPDIFRYAFHSTSLPPEGANRGRLVSSRVDRLIETAEQGDSLPAQAALYREVQQALLQLLPYIPLWYEDHVFAARTDVAGYRLARDGNYDGLQQVHRRSQSTISSQTR